MRRILSALILIVTSTVPLVAQPASTGLTRVLEAELRRFPASTGVYVKNLATGEVAAVRADSAFSSASVIKLAVMVRAFQLADEKKLNLDERMEIRRADLRDGTGVLQFHDLGLTPTVRDLITEMVITSDNTATDLLIVKTGGVDQLNAWLTTSGFTNLRLIDRGYVYRRKLLALLNPTLADITPEETTGLQYAAQNNPLFELYKPLFTGARARWVDMVRDPATARRLAQSRERLTATDRSYWFGSMTPRETVRLLEGIEQGTIASKASCDAMKVILRRQQLGVRRIPHYLDVPVGHKTGDGPTIANDAGMIYARSGTLVIAFFANAITGQYGEAEDAIGQLARLIVEYFDTGR